MRHKQVRRLAGAITVALLLWAGVFTWIAGRGSSMPSPSPTIPATGASATGATLFEQHCAACHDLMDMRAAARTRADAVQMDELRRFLDQHSDATSDENLQIIEFLTIPQQ
jgi:mono/diheme cytochrome c family protein